MAKTKGKPISPAQAIEGHTESIPPEVFEVVNELLKKAFSSMGSSATIVQEDVVAGIAKKIPDSRNRIFDEGWLDFEDAYRKLGWSVKYDKPGYCENYSAFWVFKPKKKKSNEDEENED